MYRYLKTHTANKAVFLWVKTMKKTLSKYKTSIIRPGGNDTALVKGIVSETDKKNINNSIMQSFPNVEQVGFYEYDAKNSKATLEMAGGEFCGNATRSLAYLLLKGKKGELSIKVSGTNRSLKAGIKISNTAFSYMPIYKNLTSVQKLDKDTYLVEIEGITHLIVTKSENLKPEELKRRAKELLDKKGLLYSRLASGVMFVSENKNDNSIFMEPIVWVRDIETLFYETACASGTTAVGLFLAKYKKTANQPISIKQPSGKNINVEIKVKNNSIYDATINGPIELLTDTSISVLS